MATLGHPMLVLGASMEPTLHSGQLMWVDRTCYRHRSPAPGEVVVFRHDGETYVKRVFRGPGDCVHFVSGPSGWAQGPLRQSDTPQLRQVLRGLNDTGVKVKTLRVPEGYVFVIGDNRLNSIDSRNFGPIPLEAIVGRAAAPVELSAFQYYEIPRFRRPAVANRSAPAGSPKRPSRGNGQTAS